MAISPLRNCGVSRDPKNLHQQTLDLISECKAKGLGKEFFSRLQEVPVEFLHPRDLSEVAICLSSSCREVPDQKEHYNRIILAALPRLSEFGSQEISSLVSGASLAEPVPSSFLQNTIAEVQSHLSDFSGAGIVNHLYTYTVLGIKNDDFFQVLAKELYEKNKVLTLSTHDLAMTLWAFCKNHIKNELLFEAVAIELCKRDRMALTSAGDLATIAWAFSTSDIQVPHKEELFRGLAEGAKREMTRSMPQNLAEIARSFSLVSRGGEYADLFTNIATEVIAKIGTFTLEEVVETAWAFAKWGHLVSNRNELFESLTERALGIMNGPLQGISKKNECTPERMAKIAWAYGKLRIQNKNTKELLDTISKMAVGRIEGFTSQYLAETAYAFAKLGIRSKNSTKLFAAISKKTIEIVGSFNRHELLITSRAFATLENLDIPFLEALAESFCKLDFRTFSFEELYQLALVFTKSKFPGVFKTEFFIKLSTFMGEEGRLASISSKDLVRLLTVFIRSNIMVESVFRNTFDRIRQEIEKLEMAEVVEIGWSLGMFIDFFSRQYNFRIRTKAAYTSGLIDTNLYHLLLQKVVLKKGDLSSSDLAKFALVGSMIFDRELLLALRSTVMGGKLHSLIQSFYNSLPDELSKRPFDGDAWANVISAYAKLGIQKRQLLETTVPSLFRTHMKVCSASALVKIVTSLTCLRIEDREFFQEVAENLGVKDWSLFSAVALVKAVSTFAGYSIKNTVLYEKIAEQLCRKENFRAFLQDVTKEDQVIVCSAFKCWGGAGPHVSKFMKALGQVST